MGLITRPIKGCFNGGDGHQLLSSKEYDQSIVSLRAGAVLTRGS